uniref:Smith-Magenis syndrome chromosome region, candidate 8b n=1 Tax=Cynoglossus semilaevis TaxID=244447 RepID=A0A3P8UNZ8_CYNSE
MIGSPDLLAFTGPEEFDEGEEEQEAAVLPEELSVPLLPPCRPWSSSAHFHRDFVLVAEFSEQVGPKPVLTIPDDPAVIGSFDLNHFSVRIMSVDYQASGPLPTSPASHASSGPRLNFSEDSKVILGDSAEDAFAYVQYLTLYDLQARGMVRPFCMAYVCSDQSKLMENFVELSSCFSQASDSLKTGNRQAFSMELQRKLTDLEYTRLTLLQDTEQPSSVHVSPADGDVAQDLEAVERSIQNHRDLLRQVTSYPNRKLQQPDFLPYDPADSLTDPTPLQPPERRPSTFTFSSALSPSRSECSLKPLQELCNAYFLSLMQEQLADTERRLQGDRSVLRTSCVSGSLYRKLTLTNFLFELGSKGNEEEEQESSEAELQKVMKSSAGVSRSEPVSLESFCSCVEEIPIKLEQEETMTSDLTVLLDLTGSVSSSDSIEVLGTEKSYHTQCVDGGATPRRMPSDATVKCVRAYARRGNSEDSIEVLSTTESIFPEDLTAITEEEAEQLHQNIHLENEEETETETELHNHTLENGRGSESEPPVQNHDCCGDRGAPPRQMKVNGGWFKADKSVPDLHMNRGPVPGVAEVDRWTPPCAPPRLLSLDEGSDCNSVAGSTGAPSPTRNIWSLKRKRKAALRALRFIKHNSFSQHAVFCLLSGRPLVVVGADDGQVKKLVEALSLFLPSPGPEGNAAMSCLSTPLQLTDLQPLLRSYSSITHSLTRYSRYLALLDLDHRTLSCPSYSGSLISRMVDPHTGIGRGLTFLLHLQSCLSALVNQALLYTFVPGTGGEERGAERAEFLFTRGFCSSEQDVKVLDFLSNLIKERCVRRGPPVFRFSYSSLQLHRNTHAA